MAIAKLLWLRKDTQTLIKIVNSISMNIRKEEIEHGIR